VLVHDYLTVDGTKISKSLGNTVDPVALVDRYGTDALRWWLLRAVPRVGDADFTVAGLVETANRDLANGIGNLARRVASLVHARSAETPSLTNGDPSDVGAAALKHAVERLPSRIDDALDRFAFRSALEASVETVAGANRYLELTRPWERTGAGSNVDAVLHDVVTAARVVATELAPFVPGFSARALDALGERGYPPTPSAVLFPRLIDQGAVSAE
jgi:methionyl-tRNA synthetase